MKKKMLIINRCKSSNLGDQMIGLSATALFEKHGYSVDNVDFVTSSDQRKLKLKALKRHKDKGVYKLVKKVYTKNKVFKRINWFVKNRSIFDILSKNKYDMIIIGGGELIQSNIAFPVALNLWIKYIRKTQSKVPIILFSIGISNNIKNFDKYLIGKSLKQVNQVYVRDFNSLKNLKDTFGMNAKTIPDVVFSMNVPAISNTTNKILYGVTLFERISRHNNKFSSKNEYYNHIFQELEQLKEKGEVSIFYSNPEDFYACQEFLEYTRINHKTEYELPIYNNLPEFINLIQSSSTVISPRMHALILALLCKKQVFSIGISDKINTFQTLYLEGKTHDEVLSQTKSLSQQINEVTKEIIKEANHG